MPTADLGEFFRLLTLIQIIPAMPGSVLDISSSVFNLDVEIILSLLLKKLWNARSVRGRGGGRLKAKGQHAMTTD